MTKLERKNFSAAVIDRNKYKEKKKKAKLLIAKKNEIKKTELRKNIDFYSKPKNIPNKIKIRVVKKIKTKKDEFKKLYSDPYELIKSKKAQIWMSLQLVKAFLCIPIVPGK